MPDNDHLTSRYHAQHAAALTHEAKHATQGKDEDDLHFANRRGRAMYQAQAHAWAAQAVALVEIADILRDIADKLKGDTR